MFEEIKTVKHYEECFGLYRIFSSHCLRYVTLMLINMTAVKYSKELQTDSLFLHINTWLMDLLGCDAMSLAEWFPVFWRIVLLWERWEPLVQGHNIASQKTVLWDPWVSYNWYVTCLFILIMPELVSSELCQWYRGTEILQCQGRKADGPNIFSSLKRSCW